MENTYCQAQFNPSITIINHFQSEELPVSTWTQARWQGDNERYLGYFTTKVIFKETQM